MFLSAVPKCGDGEVFSWADGVCVALPNLGKGCDGDADVVFVFDSSNNIGEKHFEKIKVQADKLC